MNTRVRAIAWSSLLLASAFLLPSGAARAEEDAAAKAAAAKASANCTVKCHEGVKFESAAHPDTSCTECHVNITADHKDAVPDDQKLKPVEVCAGCHGMAAKQFGKSVHAKKSCKMCHGPAHSTELPSADDARMSATGQIETCGKCHEEVIKGFENSVHGKGLLKSGLTEAAPSCTDCHGTHSIQKHADD
jgi:hypothetical protein